MDPWFSSKELQGAASMRFLQRKTKRIWIIGEQHKDITNADALAVHPKHIVRALLAELQKHPTEKTRIYLELPNNLYHDAYLLRSKKVNIPEQESYFEKEVSPVQKLYNAHFCCKIPDNAETIFCNIRESHPFSLFYLWTDPNRFKTLYSTILVPKYPEPDKEIKKWAKLLEKNFLEHVKNGRQTIDFFIALIFPDHSTPSWILEIERAIFESNRPNELKILLQSLLTKDERYYAYIKGNFFVTMDMLVSHHKMHTAVLGKMRRRNERRETPVLHQEAGTKWLKDYFVMLIILIQDVYMACVYGLSRNAVKNHIFIAGNLHVPFLTQMMAEGASSTNAWEHDGTFILKPEKTSSIQMNYGDFTNNLQEFHKDPSPQRGGGITSFHILNHVQKFIHFRS